MPNRRQAITWINADPVHQRIYVALGRDDLIILGHLQDTIQNDCEIEWAFKNQFTMIITNPKNVSI